MEEEGKLHVVVFPWLAFGHLFPALELSKSLASKGHHVSFISTPRNIERLPPIHPTLSPSLTFVKFQFPEIENFPQNAEASTDVPKNKASLLVTAFDALQPQFEDFIQTSTCSSSTNRPDWILYDFASHWLPPIAAEHNIPCVFFGPYCGGMLSFLGPPNVLLATGEGSRFTSLESFIAPPKWIPFPSEIVFRIHEVMSLSEGAALDDSGENNNASELYRFGVAIRDCEFVALRSCLELEPEWLNFLPELYGKPVVPVGTLHPSTKVYPEVNTDDDEKWVIIKEWLDQKELQSVVYVAFGTEATLKPNQVKELAIGLENSRVCFFWVLRTPPESSVEMLSLLPDGFVDRVKDRGIVWTSWVPQVNILGHDSVGGVVTQCGWNSVNESLGFGRVLILLPMVFDQGLMARMIEGKKLGIEIPRDPIDGSFTSESVAESIKTAMIREEGDVLRRNARNMKELLADKSKMEVYLDTFIGNLLAHRRDA